MHTHAHAHTPACTSSLSLSPHTHASKAHPRQWRLAEYLSVWAPAMSARKKGSNVFALFNFDVVAADAVLFRYVTDVSEEIGGPCGVHV